MPLSVPLLPSSNALTASFIGTIGTNKLTLAGTDVLHRDTTLIFDPAGINTFAAPWNAIYNANPKTKFTNIHTLEIICTINTTNTLNLEKLQEDGITNITLVQNPTANAQIKGLKPGGTVNIGGSDSSDAPLSPTANIKYDTISKGSLTYKVNGIGTIGEANQTFTLGEKVTGLVLDFSDKVIVSEVSFSSNKNFASLTMTGGNAKGVYTMYFPENINTFDTSSMIGVLIMILPNKTTSFTTPNTIQCTIEIGDLANDPTITCSDNAATFKYKAVNLFPTITFENFKPGIDILQLEVGNNLSKFSDKNTPMLQTGGANIVDITDTIIDETFVNLDEDRTISATTNLVRITEALSSNRIRNFQKLHMSVAPENNDALITVLFPDSYNRSKVSIALLYYKIGDIEKPDDLHIIAAFDDIFDIADFPNSSLDLIDEIGPNF